MAIKPRQDSHEHTKPLATPAATPKRPRRTPRACDRCRVKRIKCDGMVQCQPCTKTDSPCLYTHQRNSASKNYHWQMRDVMNEALRRMYVACKNRSGFPGSIPGGGDINDGDVTVQAILEGLGLISGPGDGSPKSTGFDTAHNNWRVPETSESTTPSRSTEDTVRGLVQENAPTSLRPQCRILHEGLVPPTIMVPTALQEEYHEEAAVLSTHHVDNPVTYFAHPVKSYQLVPDNLQNCQAQYYPGVYDHATHLWLESTTIPSSSAYDFSYAY